MAFNTTESISTNATVVPSDCIILQYDDFIPWNNPDNIVSPQTENLIGSLKDVVFLPISFLIGFPANVINMAVFYKQGLKDRINVCLFALSLADGLYLLCNMVSHGEHLFLPSNAKDNHGPVVHWMTKHYLLGFYGFTWVSQILSAIIASERCFCVLQPLRSRSVLKTSTITIAIFIVFVVVIGVYFIVITRHYIACGFDPLSESVIMIGVSGEFYKRHQELVDFLDAFVNGLGIPGVVIVLVMVTSIVTVVKLQAGQWRALTSSRDCTGDDGDGEGMSTQEIALTKMLVYNSVFFYHLCVSSWSVYVSIRDIRGSGGEDGKDDGEGVFVRNGMGKSVVGIRRSRVTKDQRP